MEPGCFGPFGCVGTSGPLPKASATLSSPILSETGDSRDGGSGLEGGSERPATADETSRDGRPISSNDLGARRQRRCKSCSITKGAFAESWLVD